jgi:Ser/Thr protein kinase RdoA (MazF antagonist)
VAGSFGLGRVLDWAPITSGLMNPNWQLVTTSGVFAVKQLRDAPASVGSLQQAVLPLLAARGLPVPSVMAAEVEGRFWVVARWMPGRHRAVSELSLSGCHALGDLIGRLHIGLEAAMKEVEPSLSAAFVADKPRTVDEAKVELERFAQAAERSSEPLDRPAGGRDEFDCFAGDEIGWRLRLLDRVGHRRPPDELELRPAGWTHGDLNDLNLLFDGDAVGGVLDWDRLGVRAYGLEVARSATVMFAVGDLERVAALAAGYRGRVAIGDEALRDAAHRRRWTLLTDTYFLRRHYDHGDSTCDHLFRRSAAVLRWWTTHRDDFDAALTVSGR